MNKHTGSMGTARLANYEALAQAAIRDRRIPGVVAMVGSPDDVLYASAFGPSDRTDGRPHTINEVFIIASMTKAVTSVAGAQMLEQGKFELDQPADEVLPQLVD